MAIDSPAARLLVGDGGRWIAPSSGRFIRPGPFRVYTHSSRSSLVLNVVRDLISFLSQTYLQPGVV